MPFRRIGKWIKKRWQNRGIWRTKIPTIQPHKKPVETLADLTEVKKTIEAMGVRSTENHSFERVRSGAIPRALRVMQNHSFGKRWRSEETGTLAIARDEIENTIRPRIKQEYASTLKTEQEITRLRDHAQNPQDAELEKLAQTATRTVQRLNAEILEIESIRAQIEAIIPPKKKS